MRVLVFLVAAQQPVSLWGPAVAGASAVLLTAGLKGSGAATPTACWAVSVSGRLVQGPPRASLALARGPAAAPPAPARQRAGHLTCQCHRLLS